MSRLDDELGQAMERAGELVPASTAARGGARRAAHAPKPRRGLLLALVVMGVAILALVMTSLDRAAVYSKGVDELLAQRDRLVTRNVRVEGTLVKGSLRRRDQPCEYRFALEKNEAKLAVRYPQCVVPDTFRDLPGMNVAVTIEGQLTTSGHFEAERIMAKCPSKYDMNERAAKGEQVPHADAGPVALPGSASAAKAAGSHPR